jgi:hypothetical protein
MGCGSSSPAEPPPKVVAQTKGGVTLPTEAPMQNNQFHLTAATKVVKASTTDTQSTIPIRATNSGSGPPTSAGSTASGSVQTPGKPMMAPPAIVTGCISFVESANTDGTPASTTSDTDSQSSTSKKIFAVLDRGVLVTCFPNEESEENDYVSDPIKLKDHEVIRDTHRDEQMNAQRNLTLIDSEQKETNLSFDSEKEATKWFTAFQAHIIYRNQLVDEKANAKEFGKDAVKGGVLTAFMFSVTSYF